MRSPTTRGQSRILLAAAFAMAIAQSWPVDAEPRTSAGPKRGALIVVGGGRIGEEILNRFFDLAGGKDVSIVVIPTAGGGAAYDGTWRGLSLFKSAGATNLTILHTADRAVADSQAFTAPLRAAKAVWFSGGRQWRLVDAYSGTLTQREIEKVLERGGVIGGTSAGATIQGSYLVRGAPEGNHIMMSLGHEEGFAYLKNVAIDQHLLTRNRATDLIPVIDAHQELLGIGLDESTAIVVQGDRFEVVGKSTVAIYHAGIFPMVGQHYFFLSSGDVYNLHSRSVERKHTP